MAKEIINLSEATRPEFTKRQRDFAKELIGMGLTHLTIIGLTIGKSVADLNHAEVNSGHALIASCKKELGCGVMDARRASTAFMQESIRAAARRYRLNVRIA